MSLQARLPLGRWIAFFILWQLAPFCIFALASEKMPHLYFASYLYSVCASFFIFLFIYLLFSLIKNALLRFFITFLFVLSYSVLLSVSFFSYKYLGTFTSIALLQYALELGPSNYLQYALEFMPLAFFPLLFIFAALLTLYLSPLKRAFKNGEEKRKGQENAEKFRKRLQLFGFFASAPLVLFFLHRINFSRKISLVNLDGSFFAALKSLLGMPKDLYALATSFIRFSPEKQGNSFAKAKTVVLFVNESWGQDGVGVYGASPDFMPHLSDLFQKNQERAVVLRSLFANSNATEMSMPSLMSGVAPTSSYDTLQQSPFFWDYAKACSFKTIYVSSQLYRWSNFRRFFSTPSLDHLYAAEDFNAPFVCDIGIDDVLTAQKCVECILNTPANEPLFLIYNTNALHVPFQNKSDYCSNIPKTNSGYNKAMFLVDNALHQVVEALKETGRFAESFLFFTGDHGETERFINPMPRLNSFYDQIVRVPGVIFYPQSWNVKQKEYVAHLRENAEKNVQNIDILPTLAHIFGIQDHGANAALLQQMAQGHSLLSSIPEDRIIVASNTGQIRQNTAEGFGVYYRTRRFLMTNVEKIKFFDVASDPLQQHDIWQNISEKEKNFFLNFIANNGELNRVYTKYINS